MKGVEAHKKGPTYVRVSSSSLCPRAPDRARLPRSVIPGFSLKLKWKKKMKVKGRETIKVEQKAEVGRKVTVAYRAKPLNMLRSPAWEKEECRASK